MLWLHNNQRSVNITGLSHFMMLILEKMNIGLCLEKMLILLDSQL